MSSHDLLTGTLYRPPFDGLWIGLVLLCVLIACLAAMKRERARWIALLRIAALAGLAYLLAGPSRVVPADPGPLERPSLQVLIDTSASMAQIDAAGPGDGPPVSRLDALRSSWLTQSNLKAFSALADVRLVAFDERARATLGRGLRPNGKGTRLYDALAGANADATLILSDGHDNSAQAAAGPLDRAGRLFAVPVGSPRSAPDLAIDAWPDSDRLMQGQATNLVATVRQRGFEGRDAVVELRHQGVVLQQQAVSFEDRQAKTLRFEIAPELGPNQAARAHHYTASVRLARGDEAFTANNTQDVFVQISRGKTRVLLLEGEPYWDTRSLARVLGEHPRFDLTAVYAFGEQRRSRVLGASYPDGSDPATQLTRFDVVILGRRVERLVDPSFAERLNAFVSGGGAVVFARGRPFSDGPLGRQLNAQTQPIRPGDWADRVLGQMRVSVADSGQATDTRGPLGALAQTSVVSRLPGMIAATRIEGRKAASLVLLQQAPEDDTPPLAALTTQRAGSGMAMAVLTEGLWRWELLPGVAEDPQAQSLYASFWVRATQWLASGGAFLPGQDIALQADRLTTEPGQTVTLTVSTRYIEAGGLSLQLRVAGPGDAARPITLEPAATSGHYTATFTPPATGVYRFELTAPGRADLIAPGQPLTSHIASVDRSVETRDTAAQPGRLEQLTESTGGRCLGLNEFGPLIEYLQSLQALRGADDTTAYAFNTWPAFVWIAGCFGLEWILRRRSGLR